MKYPTFLFVVLSSILFLPATTKAQIKLQMYKLGQQKALDFEQGQTMLVRMKQEREFRPLEIKKIYPEANAILTQHGLVEVSHIRQVRTYKTTHLCSYFNQLTPSYNNHLLKNPAIQQSIFQPITNLEDFVDSVIGKGLTWAGMALFNRRTYKIGDQRKLKILDLRP